MSRKNRDYSQTLIFSALLVTVARYIGAFLASDLGTISGVMSEVITALMALTGVGMGILDVIGGAYIFDGWRRGMPKAGQRWSFRFKTLSFFVFSLFGIGLIILVPFTVSRVLHSSMASVLGQGWALWVWGLAVNIAPYLLIGGVVSGQAGVVGVEKLPGSGRQIKGKIRDIYPEFTQGKDSEHAGILPQFAGQDSEVNYQDWRLLPDEDKLVIAKMNSRQIAQNYGVSPRTARNWRRQAVEFAGNNDSH